MDPAPELDTGRTRVNDYHHPERMLIRNDDNEDGEDDEDDDDDEEPDDDEPEDGKPEPDSD